MCVCVRVRLHVCVRACMHVYMYACMQACMSVCLGTAFFLFRAQHLFSLLDVLMEVSYKWDIEDSVSYLVQLILVFSF